MGLFLAVVHESGHDFAFRLGAGDARKKLMPRYAKANDSIRGKRHEAAIEIVVRVNGVRAKTSPAFWT